MTSAEHLALFYLLFYNKTILNHLILFVLIFPLMSPMIIGNISSINYLLKWIFMYNVEGGDFTKTVEEI